MCGSSAPCAGSQREPEGLGPDALAVSAEEFVTRLGARRTRLKALLLDQSFLRGIGNIYADESLFRARLHPLAIAARLSGQRALQAAPGDRGGVVRGNRERRFIGFGLRRRRRAAGLVSVPSPGLPEDGRAMHGVRHAHPPHPGGPARRPTTARIASGSDSLSGHVRDCVRDPRGHAHLPDVVHPHDVAPPKIAAATAEAVAKAVSFSVACARKDFRDGPTRIG